MYKIGHVIKELRNNKGWSQKEVGSKFNPPKDSSEISRWERDVVQPTVENRSVLASIFDVPINNLVNSADITPRSIENGNARSDSIDYTQNGTVGVIAKALRTPVTELIKG